MEKTAASRQINAIGLMSGSSLDGVDIAYCHFIHDKESGSWKYELKACELYEYPSEIKEMLLNTMKTSSFELMKADAELGKLFGSKVNEFVNKNGLRKEDIDLIGSHGHTVFHQPSLGFTTQIGSGGLIAAITNITTICDFRSLDVALGGQGAPLVPIGDELLYSQYDVCLNIGGIANLSFKPAGSERIAFDISCGNMIMNDISSKELGQECDFNGDTARLGNLELNRDLFDELNNLPFFSQKYPKSIAREFLNEQIRPLMLKAKGETKDKLAVATHHVAYQIGNAIKALSDVQGKKLKVLVTGGGAFNKYLLELIQSYNTNVEIIVPDENTVKFKEAIIFAFLGALRLCGINNTLKSVTGASKSSCGGCIYTPPSPSYTK